MDKKDIIPENNENNTEPLAEENTKAEETSDAAEDTAESETAQVTEASEESTETAEESKEESADKKEEDKDEKVRKVTDESVDFSADSSITVVSHQEEKSNKLPVIIAACVLAVVVIVAAVMYFVTSSDKAEETQETTTVYSHDSALNEFLQEALTEVITDAQGNEVDREEYIEQIKQQAQEATTTLNNNVGTASPNQIVENTTAAVSNGTQAADTEQVNQAEAQIKAFFNRSCYIQGALYAGNTGDPLAMSLNGDNFEILTNLDGTEVSVMKVEGAMYIKRPATKQYIELTDTAMDMLGLEADSFNFSFSDADFETMQSKLFATYDITVNGESGVCHEYKNGETTFKFYSVNGNLKQIDTYDASGSISSQISISYFSESIPGDQMTLKGYEKSTLGALFADML